MLPIAFIAYRFTVSLHCKTADFSGNDVPLHLSFRFDEGKVLVEFHAKRGFYLIAVFWRLTLTILSLYLSGWKVRGGKGKVGGGSRLQMHYWPVVEWMTDL